MLQREIDLEAAADIAKFEEQLERYLSGDLAEDVFRVFRLNNGIYGQRQGGTNQMVRIKLPYGSMSPEQLEMMAAFTDQSALAWQLAMSQRRMRELDILTDRDRIARDLHDHVIQRLFAVGLALQGTIPRARSAEVQQRLSLCVDDLQEVIQEIRTAIFDLHSAKASTTRLRQTLPGPARTNS